MADSSRRPHESLSSSGPNRGWSGTAIPAALTLAWSTTRSVLPSACNSAAMKSSRLIVVNIEAIIGGTRGHEPPNDWFNHKGVWLLFADLAGPPDLEPI